MNVENATLVYTDEKCLGCNKCIRACDCIGACVTTPNSENEEFHVSVDPKRCIACGACFEVCSHGARQYIDDTEEFFKDLANGEEISVLVAPAFKANYPDRYESILGGLKNLGVRHFINVSFGADIATWAYINYIKKYDFAGGISQSCAAVVSYIEKYQPELMPMLMPIQSPLICAAIYARKVLGISGKFAFLSPCIAKKDEIMDPNTRGAVSYNVTFKHFMEYVDKNNISGDPVKEEVEYGLGSFYPAPGGLRAYARWLLGEDQFIKAISGGKELYNFFRKNADAIIDRKTPFYFIEALNCENGCICGTAVDEKLSATDTALYNLYNIREEAKNNDDDSPYSRKLSFKQRMEAFDKQFSNLRLEDFIRKYTNKSYSCSVAQPNTVELQTVFMDMRKFTTESQHIDCSYCGYDSCKQMATAIFNGFNHKENCIHFLRSMLEDEQELLKYRAEHDEFLDIWNRRAAVDIIRKLDQEGRIYSVIMSDIDGFKGVNETYGNDITDQVLIKLAFELKQLTLSRKYSLARYGGDEFLFVIPDKHITPDSSIIRDIKYVFGTPISVGTETVTLTVTMGISHSDENGTPDNHIAEAETAMYEAKSKGRDAVFLYAEELREQVREENRIKDKLKEAFDNDGFYMVYQPQVDAKTKQVCGYEALVRMKEQGIYPGQFIPIAEKNGWIWRIGRITTSLVIKQLAAWREEGHELHPVSINFSSNQLSDREYIDFTENLLREYDIPPKYVEIEITEGLFLDRTAQADDLFSRFKNIGIRLLMDDFGTGYSSLGYLTYIPVDVIKLDKSLVDTYLVDGKDVFIKDVIKLMHDLDKEMVIEGVEEKWQFDRLCDFGADTIQGYYFSKPLPADEAIEFTVNE